MRRLAITSCMALTQAMMFSFLERIGMERGFGAGRVRALLSRLVSST